MIEGGAETRKSLIENIYILLRIILRGKETPMNGISWRESLTTSGQRPWQCTDWRHQPEGQGDLSWWQGDAEKQQDMLGVCILDGLGKQWQWGDQAEVAGG